jgi:hypothetical protein
MKQYKITVDNILQDSPDDCYLAPTDPIHELKIAAFMGGLGSEGKLAEYKATLRQPVVGSNKGQMQREQGIKPGTDAWFAHWFGRAK